MRVGQFSSAKTDEAFSIQPLFTPHRLIELFVHILDDLRQTQCDDTRPSLMVFRKSGSKSTMSRIPTQLKIQVAILMLTRLAEPSESPNRALLIAVTYTGEKGRRVCLQ